jgi:hypothetical protein
MSASFEETSATLSAKSDVGYGDELMFPHEFQLGMVFTA